MTLRLALLGDSIAFGQGASRIEDRPAARLARALAAQGIAVTSSVFAVPGARTAGLRVQVDRAVAWHPDLAVVVIGANDLTNRVPAHRAARDLGEAVRLLRRAGAEVVVAPAPDLSIVPHVPPAARALVRAGSHRLRAAQVEAVLGAGGRVADRDGRTATAFADDSGDGFHPSAAGYEVIASALLSELLPLASGRVPDADGQQASEGRP
jgi:lysophospholipase L1-like esterase